MGSARYCWQTRTKGARTGPRFVFGGAHLLEGADAAAGLGRPRDAALDREVDLEGCGEMTCGLCSEAGRAHRLKAQVPFRERLRELSDGN